MSGVPLVLRLAERTAKDVSEFLRPDEPIGIWEGLGGIGCTLAELSGVLGSRRLRGTALELDALLEGAIARPRTAAGLSDSSFALLLAREQIQRSLGLPVRELRADPLLASSYNTDTTRTDFFSGAAGDLCAIIWLYRRGLIDRESAERPVAAISDKLMATVRECGEVLIYENGGPGAYSDGPYHGLAHGGAGISVALAEAGVFLDSAFLRSAALALIQSELDSMLPSGFWFDTRILPPGREKTHIHTGECWCNGTVGITQALDHLAVILKDPALRRKSELIKARALLTVRQCSGEPADLCVCHGFVSSLLLENPELPWLQNRRAKPLEQSPECPDLGTIFNSATRILGNRRLAALSHYLGLSGVLQHLYRNVGRLPQNAFSLPMEIPV